MNPSHDRLMVLMHGLDPGVRYEILSLVDEAIQARDKLLRAAITMAETIVEQYDKNPARLRYIPLDRQYNEAKKFLADPLKWAQSDPRGGAS